MWSSWLLKLSCKDDNHDSRTCLHLEHCEISLHLAFICILILLALKWEEGQDVGIRQCRAETALTTDFQNSQKLRWNRKKRAHFQSLFTCIRWTLLLIHLSSSFWPYILFPALISYLIFWYFLEWVPANFFSVFSALSMRKPKCIPPQLSKSGSGPSWLMQANCQKEKPP